MDLSSSQNGPKTMTNLERTTPGPITAASDACRLSFESCLSISCLRRHEWAENRLADFNLWAARIGTSARDRASLDERLSYEQGVSIVVESLLKALNNLINNLKEHAIAYRLSKEQHVATSQDKYRAWNEDLHLTATSTFSTSKNAATKKIRSTERPVWDNSVSNTPSREDYRRDDMSDDQSAISPTDNASDFLLAQAMYDIEKVLDQLVQLDVGLRKTGTPFQLQKADSALQPEDNFLLRRHLTFLILARNRTRQDEHLSGDSWLVDFDANESSLSTVQKRLIDANMRRRNRFSYAQTHASRSMRSRHVRHQDSVDPEEALSETKALPKPQSPYANDDKNYYQLFSAMIDHDPSSGAGRHANGEGSVSKVPTPFPTPYSWIAESPALTPAAMVATQPVHPGGSVNKVPAPYLTPYSWFAESPALAPAAIVAIQPAHTGDHRDGDKHSDAGSVYIQTDPTTPCSDEVVTEATPEARMLVYPLPPKVSRTATMFTCPCCWQNLPTMFLEDQHWRKHLIGDICPYTCPLDDCPQPESLYLTRNALKAHFSDAHALTQFWQCLACCERFSKKEDFVDHIQLQHNDDITETDVPLHVAMSTQVPDPAMGGCPLCSFTLESFGRKSSALLDHVIAHIHEFSLASLPWPKQKIRPSQKKMAYSRLVDWLAELPVDVDLMSLQSPPKFLPGDSPEEPATSDIEYPSETPYFADDPANSSFEEDGSVDQSHSDAMSAWLPASALKHRVNVRQYNLLMKDEIRFKVPENLRKQIQRAGEHLADGRNDQAIELLEHVLDLNEQNESIDHDTFLALQYQLCTTYIATGHTKEAIELLERVVNVRRSRLSENDPNRLAPEYQLGRAYLVDGRIKEAIGLLEHVVNVQKNTLSGEHKDLVALQEELAKAYEKGLEFATEHVTIKSEDQIDAEPKKSWKYPYTSSRQVSTLGEASSSSNRGQNKALDVVSSEQISTEEREEARPKRKGRAREQILEHSRLACPFSKHDPNEYGRCYKHVFNNISRVKQHLKRMHSIPLYCPRCYTTFGKNSRALDQHARTGTCIAVPEQIVPGISDTIMRFLESRAVGSTTQESWYAIYDLLFPGASRPDSPFADLHPSAELLHFRDFCDRQGGELVTSALEQSAPMTYEPDQVIEIVQQVHQQVLHDLFSQYQQRHQSLQPFATYQRGNDSGSTSRASLSLSSPREPQLDTYGSKTAITSAFPCTLAIYGCPSSFASKNEWKRHLNTQHLCLQIWRCDLCSLKRTASSDHPTNDFDRKDLFIQHLRRVHCAPSHTTEEMSASQSPDKFQKTKPPKPQLQHRTLPNTEAALMAAERRCHVVLRTAPTQSRCLFCDQNFRGRESWAARVEHVARHLEKLRRDGVAVPDMEHWCRDPQLEAWLVENGVLVLSGRGSQKRLTVAMRGR